MHLNLSINSPTNYVRPDNEVHTEYPKWVNGILVPDAAGESTVLAGNKLAQPIVEPISAEPVSAISFQGETDERTMLLAVAAEKDIKIDKRWALSKIRAAVEAAQPPKITG